MNCAPRHRRTQKIQAISLIEVMLAVFVFLMMLLLVAAVLPTAARTTRYSNNYNYAVALCQRKIDQVQEAGWPKLNATNLLNLGIIDSTPEVVSGNVHIYSFTANDTATNTHGNPDNLSAFFPGGIDATARATGTIRIEPWENGDVTIGGNLQSVMSKVTVTITWREATGTTSSFAITSLVSKTAVD